VKTTEPFYLLRKIYLETSNGILLLLNANESGTFIRIVAVAKQITATNTTDTFRYK
jgi:hypothetical protein